MSNNLSFEKITEKHLPLLFAWLNSPRLKGTYDDGFSSLDLLRAKYLRNERDIQRFIVTCQGTPFGYIQSYDVNATHAYARYAKGTGKTIGIDLFIGELSFLGSGYGLLMIREFILFLGRTIARVIVDPLIGNSSLRIFEKYGFIEVSLEGNHPILAIDIRYTARALILNDQNQLLLMRVEDTTTYDELRASDHFWVTIGGTIEEGEREQETVKREVTEETGIEDFSLGELAFFGQHTLLFSAFPVRHFEKYYLTYTNQVKTHQQNLTHNEKQIFKELRWWSLTDLLSTTEVVYPRCLGIEMEKVMQGEKIPKEIVL